LEKTSVLPSASGEDSWLLAAREFGSTAGQETEKTWGWLIAGGSSGRDCRPARGLPEVHYY